MNNTKVLFFSLLFLLSSLYSFSLEKGDTLYINKKEDKLHEFLTKKGFHVLEVDKASSFKGGDDKLKKYISENLQTPPDIDSESLKSNTVVVMYTINTDGKVENVTTVRKLLPELDAEAIRVVSSFPEMTVAKKDKKNVPTVNICRVSFKDIPLTVKIEKMPEFIGGNEALALYLKNKIKYPKEAQKNKIQGRVLVRFVVDKSGKVRDAKVVKGISECSECNNMAKRVVEEMPDWKPGIQDGEAVSVYFTLPINFKLNEDQNESSPFDNKTKKRRGGTSPF